MKALISPTEQAFGYDMTVLGLRIAEVAETAFEVAAPLYWVDCPKTVTASGYYWDGYGCVVIPPPPVPKTPPSQAPAATPVANQKGPTVVA